MFLVSDFMQPLVILVLLRISSSLPPHASIRHPRYVKDGTSSMGLPRTDTDAGFRLAVFKSNPRIENMAKYGTNKSKMADGCNLEN